MEHNQCQQQTIRHVAFVVPHTSAQECICMSALVKVYCEGSQNSEGSRQQLQMPDGLIRT